jgi:hypothetical protein
MAARSDGREGRMCYARVLACLCRARPGRLELADVAADTEGPTVSPANDDASKVHIAVTVLEDLSEPPEHRDVDGIELLRPVQNDDRDRAVSLDVDWVVHA